MTAQHEPTAEQRAEVKALASHGTPQDTIADYIGVDPKTLRLHYRDELDQGMAHANVKVVQSLFNMATEGKQVAAAIFWCKARLGMSEKTVVHVETGATSAAQFTNDQLAAIASGATPAVANPDAG